MDTKHCPDCNTTKPIEAFVKLSYGRGYGKYCKVCYRLRYKHPVQRPHPAPQGELPNVSTRALERLEAYKLEAKLGCSRKGRK